MQCKVQAVGTCCCNLWCKIAIPLGQPCEITPLVHACPFACCRLTTTYSDMNSPALRSTQQLLVSPGTAHQPKIDCHMLLRSIFLVQDCYA